MMKSKESCSMWNKGGEARSMLRSGDSINSNIFVCGFWRHDIVQLIYLSIYPSRADIHRTVFVIVSIEHYFIGNKV